MPKRNIKPIEKPNYKLDTLDKWLDRPNPKIPHAAGTIFKPPTYNSMFSIGNFGITIRGSCQANKPGYASIIIFCPDCSSRKLSLQGVTIPDVNYEISTLRKILLDPTAFAKSVYAPKPCLVSTDALARLWA